MTPIERETFLMHSEQEDYQAKIAKALEIVQAALDSSKKPYVAYSGGKDSLVLADMVLRACPNVLIWHFWFGPYYFPDELEYEVLSAVRSFGATNIKVDTSEKYCRGRTPKNIFFPELHGKIIPQMVTDGYDLSFVGLRKEESSRRKAKASKPIRWTGKMLECYPLADLTARDIWTYIVTRKLPYCSHYDRYGALLGIEHVRMSTFFDPEFDKFGASNLDSLLMPEFKHLYIHGL